MSPELPELKSTSQGVVRAHAKIDGDLKSTASKKDVFRDFIWAYRCIKALQNMDFRKLFLEHGFNRLGAIKEFESTIVIDTTSFVFSLEEVYKMDFSLALLLDTHINRPAYVDSTSSNTPSNNKWVSDLKKLLEEKAEALKEVGTDVTKANLLSIITEKDERKLIKEHIIKRNNSGMTDPDGRCSNILSYAKSNKLTSFYTDLGYSSLNAFCSGLSLSRRKINRGSKDLLSMER